MIFVIVLSTFIFLADRLLKILVFSNLNIGDSIPLIPGVVHITPVENTGVAFGLLENLDPLVFIFITFVSIFLVIIYFFVKKPSSFLAISALSIICGGALGNLFDRFFYGHVLDFIDLRIWPVFNIADAAISIGAVLLFVYLFKRERV